MNCLKRIDVLRAMRISLAITAAMIAASRVQAADPTEMPLWPAGAPGAAGTAASDTPSVAAYLPPKDKACGTAVVVCPGGGYGGLAMDHEGRQIAQWLNDRGVAAFILRYRHAPKYKHPTPLGDAQRAVRYVRSRAKEDGFSPDRVGIWGFSAGGHLASTTATHFDAGKADASDPIDRWSCRPDFAILCYPVISMRDPIAHAGSRRNLLGDNPSPELLELLSNEKQVTAQTPPTFLFHTMTDKPVPPENSIVFYQALLANKVPAELHVYERGPHGVGLAAKDPVLSSWPARLEDWLKAHGWLKRPEA